MNRARKIAFCALLSGLILSVMGCAREYELNVLFPADTIISRDGGVFVDGMHAGRVADISQVDSKLNVVVVIQDRELANTRIKHGIMAVARDDGGIDLDASRIDRSAKPLPRGSTIEGSTRLELLLRKYAVWQTVVTAALSSLFLVMVTWVFQRLFRAGVVIASLALSGAIAFAFYPFMVPVVERIYAAADEARGGGISQEEPKPDLSIRELDDDVGAVDGEPYEKAVHHAGTERSAVATQTIERVVERIARPSPNVVALFGTWLIMFFFIQTALGLAFRATRGRD